MPVHVILLLVDVAGSNPGWGVLIISQKARNRYLSQSKEVLYWEMGESRYPNPILENVSSVDLRRRLYLTSIPALLVQRRLRWVGHVARRPKVN